MKSRPLELFGVEIGLSGWRAVAWPLLAPVRAYLRKSPLQRGKGVLLRSLILPVLPETGAFNVRLPGGQRIEFGYRERIGQGFLLRGEFESSEVAAALTAARPGTTVIDVGANVGLFSIALATRVGLSGKVIAVEPLAENVGRIRATVARNGLENVVTVCSAAGSIAGTVKLNLAADSAFTSVGQPKEGALGLGVREVEQCTLDAIWSDLGCPTVSFVKIDVEGMELEVLRGAAGLLERCRPVLLLEANGDRQLMELREWLKPYGYGSHQPIGFEPWNHLFLHGGGSACVE